jgi:hypothetical protein
VIAIVAAAAFALIVSAGCGGGGGSNSSGGNGTNSSGGGGDCSTVDALCGADPTTLTATATTPKGLTATLTQSVYSVETNSPADTDTYSMTLQNNTNAGITITVTLDTSNNIIFPGNVVVRESVSTVAGSPPAVVGNLIPPNGTTGPFGTPEQYTLQPGASLQATMSPSFAPPHVGRFLATGYILDGETPVTPNGVTTATSIGPLTLSAH